MGASSTPGPTCGATRSSADFRDGTMCLQPTPSPSHGNRGSALSDLQSEIDQLQTTANQFARVSIKENAVRQGYLREISEMSRKLVQEVRSGLITPTEGARVAQELREGILDATRLRSTPFGRAWAQQMKTGGPTLDALLDHYAGKLYQQTFAGLRAEAQQNAVYLEVVMAAGRDRSWIAPALSRAAKVGRGLVVVSIGYSVYEIATADDKLHAAGHEASALGAGMLGGLAGGAVAGLACGPGAPVCVAAIIFVGGAIAAWGGGAGFEWLSRRP